VAIERDGDDLVLEGGSQKAFLAASWSVFLLVGL